MIADLKPYPAYKDSGVPWLGRVPLTWSIARNGALFAQRNETGFPELPVLEVSLKTGIRVRNLGGNGRKQVMSDHGGYKRCRERDISYNMMRMWQGAIGVAPIDGLVSPAYVVAQPFHGVNPRFYECLFRTDAYMSEVDKSSHGIVKDRNRLYWEEFKQMPSPVPPPDEQDAIVRFLEHADRRIRRYIRAKQKLIKLLEEQMQAIIHRAVTRGLDPGVRFKPSGVEWLGDLPEHWELQRLKFLVRIPSGQIDPREQLQKNKVLISPNHIRSGAGRLLELETAEAQGADSGKYEVQEGQVVYSKIRPNLRKAAIAPVDCLCSADMYPLDVRQAVLRPGFLLLLLLSEPFTKYAVDCSHRVAMPKINRKALGECWLWFPSPKEQDEILEFVESVSIPTAERIAEAERGSCLLREFQTRLVSDVVTGKLDVREAAARLPDEPEEPEPQDELEVEGDAEDADDGDAAFEESDA